jgi:hypothetical protein
MRASLHESNARREALIPTLLPAKSGEKEKRQRQFQERDGLPSALTSSPSAVKQRFRARALAGHLRAGRPNAPSISF